MDEDPGTHDAISEETLLMVARIRERAAQSPGSAEIADLLTSAAARGSEMTAEEIRDLGRDTIDLVSQVSHLLGRLAGLLDEEDL